jgi:eukaryotic-like serine/threonine-protein kinase
MIEAIGRYKILEAIGRGAMGDLYRARDTSLGRTVAIRVVSPAIADNPEQEERLLSAARRAAAVSHPNIAAVYEVGEESGASYLAGEFVAGQPLKSLVAGHSLNPRRAIDFGIQIADALADAHAAGLVHGDLHPGNVIVTPKGGIKILDFGLADWTASGANRTDTVADDQQDILSLGSILFVMLTGRPPSGVRTLTAIDPALPRELDPIVLKASSRNRNDCYGSAAALAAELRSVAAILDVRQEASQGASFAPIGSKPASRHIGWLIALLALGAVGWIVWMAARAT